MKAMLSMDIGSSRIKIAQGYYKKGNLYIKNVGQIPVPQYCIEKERIINAKVIADDISNYLKNQHMKSKDVIVTINAVGAIIRDIDLPKAKSKELDSMIKNEMLHTYHVGETNAMQYKLIDTFKDDTGAVFNKYRVAALNSDITNGYYELIKMLKLSPLAMDINMNVLDKLFSTCKTINDQQISNKAIMFIDFGAKYTAVYISLAGKQQIFRQLSIGSSEIEKIISDETLSSCETIKKQKEEGFDFLNSENENEQYYSALKPYFYNLNEELRNIIRFYTNRFEADPITQIFIMGGGSNLAGLAEYLQTNLNTPVSRIENMSNINNKNPKYAFHEYMNALGALIRY